VENGKTFHDKLTSVIAASGVRRVDLARHLDVTLPELNRWLNGTSAPNVHQFKAIAQYFNLPYAWFLDEKEDFK